MDDNNQSTGGEQGEESFAELFEKSFKKQGRLEPGQMVETVIVKITSEWIFLDLGGKGEGYLDRKEMLDAEGNLSVKEGDRIRAFFLSAENNEMHFTTKIGSGPAGHTQLEDAWRNGTPVEGTVTKEVKGGFEVKIAGSARAFCPFSQMGIRREEWKETLKEGMKIRGTVTSLQGFGAFVDIGGLEGLIQIAEIAWGRTENIRDVLSVGREVEVIVKKLDWEKGRFSFSLKDTLPDPWERVA